MTLDESWLESSAGAFYRKRLKKHQAAVWTTWSAAWDEAIQVLNDIQYQTFEEFWSWVGAVLTTALGRDPSESEESSAFNEHEFYMAVAYLHCQYYDHMDDWPNDCKINSNYLAYHRPAGRFHGVWEMLVDLYYRPYIVVRDEEEVIAGWERICTVTTEGQFKLLL